MCYWVFKGRDCHCSVFTNLREVWCVFWGQTFISFSKVICQWPSQELECVGLAGLTSESISYSKKQVMEGSEQTSSLVTALLEEGFLPSTTAPSGWLMGAHTGTSEGKGNRESASAGGLSLAPRLLQDLPAPKKKPPLNMKRFSGKIASLTRKPWVFAVYLT